MGRRRKRKVSPPPLHPSSSSSSSSSSSEHEESSSEYIEDEQVDTIVFTWEERTQYLDRQLTYMEQLSTISRNCELDDTSFSLALIAKIENMYRQIESLLEAEDMSACSKASIAVPMEAEYTSITKEIERLNMEVKDFDLKKVGIKASNRYRRRYGRPPRKMARYIDGKPRLVNQYTMEEADYCIVPVLKKKK